MRLLRRIFGTTPTKLPVHVTDATWEREVRAAQQPQTLEELFGSAERQP